MKMNETFKWGGHLPIIIVLLTMLTPKLLQMPRCMYYMGGIAIVVVSAPLLFVFGAPIVQLQVCRCSCRYADAVAGMHGQLQACQIRLFET